MGSWAFDLQHGWHVDEVHCGGVIDALVGAGGVELTAGGSANMSVLGGDM